MNKKAFTLIELMVSIAIFSLVILFIYSTYTGILLNFKDITKKSETQAQVVPALNVLRLDLEHAGYGLDPNILTNKPLEWDNTSKTLKVRSTINTTNNNTIGWEMVQCSSPGGTLTRLASDDNTTYGNNVPMVWLDAKDNNRWVKNGTAAACPGPDIGAGSISHPYVNPPAAVLLGFPYDSSVTNGCDKQYCNCITYSLSTSQNILTCNPSTLKLLRKIGNGNGTTILNCVGGVNVTNATNSILTNVYILLQEGRKNKNIVFSKPSLSIDNTTFDMTNISDYKHYRWKLIKLSVKPMSGYKSL